MIGTILFVAASEKVFDTGVSLATTLSHHPSSEATGMAGNRAFSEIAGEGWALSFDW